MKKLLATSAIALAVSLLFSGAAHAWSYTIDPNSTDACEGIVSQEEWEACVAEKQALQNGVPPDPTGYTDPSPQVGDTCPPGYAAFGDPGTGQLTCLAPEELAPEGQYASPEPAAVEEVSCEDFVTASGEPSQWQAQQFYDFVATPEQRAMLDPDGDGFACSTPESQTEPDLESERAEPVDNPQTASEAYAELPDTGGGGLPLVPLAGAALIGAGLLSRAVDRGA